MKRGGGRRAPRPRGRRRETPAARHERRSGERRQTTEEPRSARGITGQLFVTAAGDGLLLRDDGEAVAKIPGAALGGALHGDRVRAVVVREAPVWARAARGRTGRPQAEVREVLERAPRRLTGRLRQTPAGLEFEPDDAKFPLRLAVDGPAQGPDGTPVVAALRPFDPAAARRAAVEVVAAFPARGGIGMEIDRILVREGLHAEFPPDAVAQAAALTPESLLGGTRRDLTHLPFVTIDPEDARDHDDAVAVVPAAAGAAEAAGAVDAWVAIADVGAAVPAGTPLDREARARGVSVYLPDRVLRMLPDAPSADACSLRAARERAALAVRVRLDADGRPVGPAEVVRAVVRSRAYLTYGQVGALLGGDAAEAEAATVDPETLAALVRADQAARRLRARRLAAGALDLEQPEALILPDGAGGVASIRARATTATERDAYRLVEELMLLANRAVARWLLGRGAPAVFRVHEPPDEAELRRFAVVARHYGIPLRVDRAPRPGALADALRAMQGRPFAQPLASLLLRALRQARYAPDNLGHFGLAFREYLHFTSPIRRYPDLVVHRLVAAVLDGATPGELTALGEREDLAGAAATSSARERRAMLVEREVVDLCGAWVLRGRIGEEFAGRVAGIAAPGVFVRLQEPFVEGLLALEDLPVDEWRFHAEELRLTGAATGRSFRLGDELRVRVLDASLARRRGFFALVEGGARGRRAGRPSRF